MSPSTNDGGWRMGALAAACLTLLLGVAALPARAAELPAIEPSAAIAARIRWIQFHMVSGRVMASSGLVVPKMIVPSTNARTNRRELLSIEINNPLTGLQYDLSTPSEQFQILVAHPHQLSIRRTRPAEKYSIQFQQHPNQPVLLTLEQGGEKHSWQAQGFWQLWIAESEVVRQHLIPLLELLHPSWQLALTGAEIEDALSHPTRLRQQPDRQQWDRWVDDLASPKFARRESAQRELYKAGQVVVPFLQNLDRRRLDAEQTYRVRALVEALSVDYEDKVERVVTWLAGDDQIWLALLERGEVAKRRVAASELSELLGSPIEFDTAGSDAVRQEQLGRLRSRLREHAADKGESQKAERP